MEKTQSQLAKGAIDRALLLLGPQITPDANGVASAAPGTIQASDTRAVLDLLVASDPAKLLAGELNLRHMTQSLFDWHGTKRSTKPLLHAFHNALQVPGRYDHAVELTAFLSALSPMLEPDRLARLYALVNEVETVYSPVRYTVSLSNKLQSVLGQYQPQRIEQLAATLWIDSHSGRWWDMTDGVTDEAVGDGEQPADRAAARREAQRADVDPIEQLLEIGRTAWSPKAAAAFAALPYDERVHAAFKKYVKRANGGDDVDPDMSVLAAAVAWLPILDRPESPIAPLIHTLRNVRETLAEVLGDDMQHLYSVPDKPKSFRALFPDVRLYGDQILFPYHREVLATDGRIKDGVTFDLITTVGELQENREYMGNCTWSYKARMEKGTHAIYRLHHDGAIYNASMSADGGRWKVGEVNARFNGRDGHTVPASVRKAFDTFVRTLSAASAVETQKLSAASKVRIKARFSVI